MDMTDDETRRIGISEFREAGYLQEVNRRLLHPLGLALEVVIEEDGTERLGGVLDYRDDPEGIRYGGTYLASLKEKADNVDRLWSERKDAREGELGYMVQPPDAREDDNGMPVS